MSSSEQGRVESGVRGYSSPGRYFQGPGLLDDLQKFTVKFGSRVYLLLDRFFFDEYSKKYEGIYGQAGEAFCADVFGGESTEEECKRVAAGAKSFGAQVIVGIGGGKTLDTAKVAANNLGLPVICSPTTASTDAPCSGLSIIYNAQGVYDHYIRYAQNPNVVLVDSKVIAKAPIKYLVAGIGDALVTYFEALANAKSDSKNCVQDGYRRTCTGMAVAKACYEVLRKDAKTAIISAKAGLVTEALENVIEANTLMSGIGFENVNVAGAHSVGDGFTVLPGCNAKTLHGQRCGFGLICQLVAEDASTDELEDIILFNMEVGLPVTLEDMGFEATEELMRTVAKQSMFSYWQNEPFYMDEERVYHCIAVAQKLGEYYKGKAK